MARLTKVLISVALGATALTSTAHAKTEISPYIEVGQVLSTDVKGGDDSILTYSTVAAGIEANITNSRAEFQMSYRYERRFDYQKDVGDEDVHSGLARGRYDLVENMLSIEGGALAARTRSDIRGAAPLQGVGNVDNLTQVYSAYAGPSFATSVGALDIAAAYRFGYTRVEAPNSLILSPGQRPLDVYDDSKTHYVTGSVGMEAGTGVLPVGWLVSGGFEREDAGQLDQSYTSKYVRGDLTVPVTPTIAIVGGIGYEDIQIKERDALLDVNGDPVTNSKGRFATDPTSPKRLTYDLDGIYWDAGVMWKPSSRTMLEARVGRRYGTMSYTGSFSWQTGENSGIQLAAYDEVETFGQQLNDNLSQMPINFRSSRSNGLSNGFSGCTFGGSFGGGCLGDAFQAASTAAYRSRGALAVYSATQGRWTKGIGFGYNQRKFIAPVVGAGITVDGLKDQSWFAQGNMEYALSENSSLAADVYTEMFDPGIAGAGNVLSAGVTGSYYHQFGRKLSASTSVGVYSQRVTDFEDLINLSATAGLRYSF